MLIDICYLLYYAEEKLHVFVPVCLYKCQQIHGIFSQFVFCRILLGMSSFGTSDAHIATLSFIILFHLTMIKQVEVSSIVDDPNFLEVTPC